MQPERTPSAIAKEAINAIATVTRSAIAAIHDLAENDGQNPDLISVNNPAGEPNPIENATVTDPAPVAISSLSPNDRIRALNGQAGGFASQPVNDATGTAVAEETEIAESELDNGAPSPDEAAADTGEPVSGASDTAIAEDTAN